MSRAQEIFEELQTLDPQNPGAWPLYARIGAAVLAALVILGAAGYFLIKPSLENLEREERTEVQLRQEFETKQRKVAALDAYRAQLAEMERSFGAMLRQLPSRTEVANLLNDISQTRVASSLEEELFRPSGEVPKEFYAELPNQIIVIGSYHQMGEFVSGIAALSRIVTIESVDIKAATAARGGRGATAILSSGPLRMEAVAKTYRYLDDEELAAQAAAQQPQAGGRGRR
jgi:type IV pilus assembly protein PilO